MKTLTDESIVTIEDVVQNQKPYLQFNFIGHLNEQSAKTTIALWKNAFATKIEKRINLIYNCSAMTGFDTDARRAWQAAMNEHKSKIGTIWLVCDNFFILGAAKTMGVLTGFNIRVAKSLKDIKD